MVLRYAHQLDQPVDVLKCLKIAIVHDLPEAIAGDIPVMEAQTSEAKKRKEQAELEGMTRIKDLLGDGNGEELFEIWMDYERQDSYESKFVKALDKLEVFIQHNEAPIETWEYGEKEMMFQDKWLRKYCAFDSFLNAFANRVTEDSLNKLKAAGEDLEAIKKTALEKAA